MLIAEQTKQS